MLRLKRFFFSSKTLFRKREKMKNVVFFADHPAGAKAVAAVANKLIEESKVVVTVIGHNFSKPIFEGVGLAYKTIEDFGLADISVHSVEKLLKAVSADLVIAGAGAQEGKANDIIELTCILASRNLGITSVTIFGDWQSYTKCFSDERTGIKLDCMPDYVAIMDEYAKKEMIEKGLPENKLVITGNPAWDHLLEKSQSFTDEEKEEVKRKIGLDCQTLFFFASNMFHQFEATDGFWTMETLKLIINQIPTLPGVGVVVRFHPRMPQQEKDQLKKVVEESGTTMKVVDDIDSLALSLVADLTIIESSNTGIEAVYMRRPVISLQPGLKVKDNLVISRLGIVPVGYEDEDCRRLLRDAVNPDYRDVLLKQSASFTNEEKATDNVVNLVYSLLS